MRRIYDESGKKRSEDIVTHSYSKQRISAYRDNSCHFVSIPNLSPADSVSAAIKFVKITARAMELYANKTEATFDKFITSESLILIPGKFVTRRVISKFHQRKKNDKMTDLEFSKVFNGVVAKKNQACLKFWVIVQSTAENADRLP